MYYNLKKIETIFEKISRHGSKWDTFHSILDFSLIPYRYYSNGKELQAAHQQLLAWPNKESIVEFMTEVANLQPEGFKDPLGEFYMLHLSNGHMGQYFTPEPVTQMMAQTTVGESPRDGQTILDPACGSGRFLLSAAKMNRHMRFYGADLDGTCCKMAVLNMVLNSLTGEIAHMNSLANEFYRGYSCRTKLIDSHYYPYFIEFTEPEKSRIWLHPRATTPAPSAKPFDPKPVAVNPNLTQGSLF